MRYDQRMLVVKFLIWGIYLDFFFFNDFGINNFKAWHAIYSMFRVIFLDVSECGSSLILASQFSRIPFFLKTKKYSLYSGLICFFVCL